MTIMNNSDIRRQARNLRRRTDYKIKKLEKAVTDSTDRREANWYRSQIRTLENLKEETKFTTSRGGKQIRRDASTVEDAMSRLEMQKNATIPEITEDGDDFEVTQNQLNAASGKGASVYTHAEVQTFYRATQDIWQTSEFSEDVNRNELILEHFNAGREEKGLRPYTLTEIVDYIIGKQEYFSYLESLETDSTHVDQDKSEKAAQLDNSDSPKGSPPGVSEMVFDKIKESFEEFITAVDSIEDDESLGDES